MVIGQSNKEIASTEHGKEVEASAEKLIQATRLEVCEDILKRRDQVIEWLS